MGLKAHAASNCLAHAASNCLARGWSDPLAHAHSAPLAHVPSDPLIVSGHNSAVAPKIRCEYRLQPNAEKPLTGSCERLFVDYFGGAGVNTSGLRPGSGFGLGLGA